MSKYSKEKMEENAIMRAQLDRMEKENAVMRAQLVAFDLNGHGDSIFLDWCCYSTKSKRNFKDKGDEKECDFWFINGGSSDLNQGIDVGVVHCGSCYNACCKSCVAIHGWSSEDGDYMCPECSAAN